MGLTVPRAIGGSVVRNRIKRRIREAFRLHRAEIGPHDCGVIAAKVAPLSDLLKAGLRLPHPLRHPNRHGDDPLRSEVRFEAVSAAFS